MTLSMLQPQNESTTTRSGLKCNQIRSRKVGTTDYPNNPMRKDENNVASGRRRMVFQGLSKVAESKDPRSIDQRTVATDEDSIFDADTLLEFHDSVNFKGKARINSIDSTSCTSIINDNDTSCENLDDKEGPSKRKTQRGSRVTFGMVHIRHYEVILSDNPACRDGPSIGIGWRYANARSFSLKTLESRKDRSRKTCELIYNRAQREHILREWCVLQKDIAAMMRVTRKVRCQRRRTIGNMKYERVQEGFETFFGNLSPRFVSSKGV